MIAIVDYGVGNLRSVEKALLKLGHPVSITSDPEVVAGAERVILPGVGAFGAAMAHLEGRVEGRLPLSGAVRDAAASGKPFLGICVGMQLLFSRSEELGQHEGLGLVPGNVVRFDNQGDESLKIPHMGWNELSFPRQSPLFEGLEERVTVYFVHSFYCQPNDPSVTAATCRHGIEFCAALRQGNVYATQFHPEKSGAPGLRILDNFAKL